MSFNYLHFSNRLHIPLSKQYILLLCISLSVYLCLPFYLFYSLIPFQFTSIPFSSNLRSSVQLLDRDCTATTTSSYKNKVTVELSVAQNSREGRVKHCETTRHINIEHIKNENGLYSQPTWTKTNESYTITNLFRSKDQRRSFVFFSSFLHRTFCLLTLSSLQWVAVVSLASGTDIQWNQ
jgi:hypothetical protein